MLRGVFDRMSSKEARVLMLGLDAAGKTTIVSASVAHLTFREHTMAIVRAE